jgi:ubiquinone/menaquinone biosynthesis C-methylase UbiE
MRKNAVEKYKSSEWDKAYLHLPKKESIWTDLNFKYDGASPYIVEKIKKLPKSAKILDAGCGDGRNLIYLSKLGRQVSGIDISKKAIEKTGKMLKRAGLEADLLVGDLFHLPYANESFDVIIYDFVNVHIEKPELVLKEFFRVLKNDGLLLFETTSKYDPLFKGRNKYKEKGFYFRFYNRREMIKLIEKYFNIVKIELNTIWHRNHGKGYARRDIHFHKSYLLIAIKH